MKLKNILLLSLILWCGACLLVHGTTIIYYLLIQLVTSGLFTYEFSKIEKNAKRRIE